MPTVLVSILVLFCQSRFPMVNKTNSGRVLSSLYKESVCNQSLHLPTHHSLPPSPTSFNPFILLIHLPIHPHQLNRSLLVVQQQLTFLNTLQSVFESQFSIFCLYPSELLFYQKHHPASHSSRSTVTPGSCPVSPQPSPAGSTGAVED